MGPESWWAWRAASEPDEPDDDDLPTPGQARRAPEPPQELWGLDDGRRLHGAGEGDVMAWESRDDAAGHALETQRPVLLGVHPEWRRRALAAEAALRQLVADWDDVDPRAQVPDEINVDDHWDAARAALAAGPSSSGP